MSEIQVSMTKLRHNLGDLVNRASYGGERVIVMSRGEPKAAIIGIEELLRLEESRSQSTSAAAYTSLQAADEIRARIKEWQETYDVEPEDAVDVLHDLRGLRDDELGNLR